MKKLLLLISVLIILVAIPATVYLVSQQQELRKKAAPATTLSLTPATLTRQVGDTFPLEVSIDTGDNQVVAAEIHLVFDPTVLQAVSITNSSLFPSILTSGVVDNGVASITVGAANVQTPVHGTGTVAVVQMKALSTTAGPVSVRFADNTFVGGLGEAATNILVGSSPAVITVTGAPGASPGPSPAPAVSPALTQNPAASPTPALSPPGTATESASPSALLSLTPTPHPATGSGETASESAVAILSPAGGTTATSDMPTFRGKAPPNTTVTLTIYSTPQTVVLTADSNGNWSYTPAAPLADGPHNVVASATDTGGTTQTASAAFVVASGGSTEIATQSAIPVTGTIDLTYAALAVGAVFILSGLIIPLF
ncbi:Ig-like domain-containing protein [Patescibacteria group bacterium]|nr:Ig-like domain-containing protein [Patescibacteria group bacterium]